MSEEEKAEQRFELEKHLHEQYAINTNAHTASFISFVVALLVLFGAFGYVYAHTLNAWSSSEYDQLTSVDSGYVLVPVQSNGLGMAIPQKDLLACLSGVWRAVLFGMPQLTNRFHAPERSGYHTRNQRKARIKNQVRNCQR